MTSEPVTISQDEYDSLYRDSQILAALERSGVDNWVWYGEALQDLED